MKLETQELVTIIQKRHPDSLVFSSKTGHDYYKSFFILPIEDINYIGFVFADEEYGLETSTYRIDGNTIVQTGIGIKTFEFANDDFAEYFMNMGFLHMDFYVNEQKKEDWVDTDVADFDDYNIPEENILNELLDEYANSLPVIIFYEFGFKSHSEYYLIQNKKDFIELTRGWGSNELVKDIVTISNRDGRSPLDVYKETVEVEGSLVIQNTRREFGQYVGNISFKLGDARFVDYFIKNMSMSFDYGRPAKAAFA